MIIIVELYGPLLAGNNALQLNNMNLQEQNKSKFPVIDSIVLSNTII